MAKESKTQETTIVKATPKTTERYRKSGKYFPGENAGRE